MKITISIILILAFAAFLIWHSRKRIIPAPFVPTVPNANLKSELIVEYNQCIADYKKLLLKHDLAKSQTQKRALLLRIAKDKAWIDGLRISITNEYLDVKFK